MGLVIADILPAKRAMLMSKGINVDRIVAQNARHHTISAPRMARARASSHYLKFGNKRAGADDYKKSDDKTDNKKEEDKKDGETPAPCEGDDCPVAPEGEGIEAPCPEGDLECEQAKETAENLTNVDMSDYYEKLSLGLIDGFVSNFNENCRVGLSSSVISFFDVMDNLAVYDPTKVAKFQLASVNFTEATNQVYAYCDVNQLTKQFSYLADYNAYENYIVFASRIGGTLINTYGEMMTCIDDGSKKGNGFDVGYCGSTLASTLLDTSF